jgi:hypothetical protein
VDIRDDLAERPGFGIPDLDAHENGWSDPPVPQVEGETETPNPPKRIVDRLQFLRPTGSKPETQAADTRTAISSRDSERAPKVGVKEATIALAGLIGVATLGAAWLIQRKSHGTKTFRQPTGDEAGNIAAPLARIAARCIPSDLLAPSIADAIAAMSATGAYVTSGPIIIPNVVKEKTE